VVPPLACRRFEYVVPCVPDGTLDVVTVKAVGVAEVAATTRRVTMAVAVLSNLRVSTVALESVTLTSKEKLPVEVGVPEMVPVVAARLSPAGSFPLAMLQV
jgi:hypothetical protein